MNTENSVNLKWISDEITKVRDSLSAETYDKGILVRRYWSSMHKLVYKVSILDIYSNHTCLKHRNKRTNTVDAIQISIGALLAEEEEMSRDICNLKNGWFNKIEIENLEIKREALRKTIDIFVFAKNSILLANEISMNNSSYVCNCDKK